VIHSDPVAEIQKINSIKTNILLGAYGLGKSQAAHQSYQCTCATEKDIGASPYYAYQCIYQKMGIY